MSALRFASSRQQDWRAGVKVRSTHESHLDRLSRNRLARLEPRSTHGEVRLNLVPVLRELFLIASRRPQRFVKKVSVRYERASRARLRLG